MPTKLETPQVCPVCGDDVPARALACPECGADHNSGWRDDADTYDAAGLPDEEFDYDAFVREEFGGGGRPAGLRLGWWITAILVLVAMIALLLFAAN